jgi:hypothetical protein
VADGALVANANNEASATLASAQRTIAHDTCVAAEVGPAITNWLVYGSKSVSGVSVLSVFDAIAAVVPVRALQALVTNTANVLITAITDSIVADITTSCQS